MGACSERQGLCGIGAGGTPRRNQRRAHRDGEHESNRQRQNHRVRCAHLIQPARREPAGRVRAGEAEDGSGCCERPSLPDHHPEDIRRRRTKRHPRGHFGASLRRGIGDDAVNTDRGQHECHRAKHHHQRRPELLPAQRRRDEVRHRLKLAASSGSAFFTTSRIAGTSDAGSASAVATTTARRSNGTCVSTRYMAGSGSVLSDAYRTSLTTPTTGRRVLGSTVGNPYEISVRVGSCPFRNRRTNV